MMPAGTILAQLTGRDESPAEEPLALFQERAELPADQHPAAVYIASLGEGSRRAQTGALRELARLLSGGRQTVDTLPWHRVRYQHTAALRAVLMERYAPATVNRLLAALRGTLRQAWLLGLVGAEEYHRAAVVSNIHAEILLAGRALAHGELRQLFALCAADPTARGRRDAAVLALLYGLGLRRAEAVAVRAEDFFAEERRIAVRQSKGRRDREVYAGPGTIDALNDWMAVRGAAPGPLLCRVARYGQVELAGMTPQNLYSIVGRLGQAAGLAAFCPHDLRRTFTSELLDAGADLSVVRQLVGHANVNTTARYDRRGEQAKIRASTMLPVPYMPPGSHRKPQDALPESAEGSDTGGTGAPSQEGS